MPKNPTSKMEVIRYLDETDPCIDDVLNRPHSDLEIRTDDLDRFHAPARGLRVRQETTPSGNIEVEVGKYIGSDGVTIRESNLGAVQTIVVPAASVGQIRADLIYFNLDTGVSVRLAGVEVPFATGFSSALWPTIPSGLVGAVPLAILYVDAVPTPFDETINTDVAGRIIDVRPSPGANKHVFSPTLPSSDIGSGVVGTAATVARSDHRHARNVDATVPESLNADKIAAVGAAATYAVRDHVHPIAVEAVPGNIQRDGVASVGSSANLVRSNHVHPLCIDDAIIPSPVSLAAAVGVASRYSRADHAHAMTAVLSKAVSFFGMSNDVTVVSVAVIGVASAAFAAPITVPANTYQNGIIVVATAVGQTLNASPFHYSLQLEVLLDQGATLKKLAPTPTTIGLAFNGSARANLGATPLAWLAIGNAQMHIANTTMSIGLWAKAGTTGLVGAGGSDWDPTQDTVINFGNMYTNSTGGGTGTISNRGILVFGF